MSACRRADGADAEVAGKNRTKNCCTNIAVMQLFHELKQQFPTVPDDVVSACIVDHCHDRPACRQRLLEAAAIAVPRTLPRPQTTMTTIPSPQQQPEQPEQQPEPPIGKPPIQNKRFSNSNIKSETCGAVSVTDLSKHFTQQCEVIKNVRPASLDLKKFGENSGGGGGVNVSLNLNLTPRKHSTVLQVTPEPVWCQHMSGMSSSSSDSSPRSYTSVNLTLRTPCSEPQPPIDICSSPASGPSLTYTTSSFDSRQGLESCLQITVGPGAGVGTVTALRTRAQPTTTATTTTPTCGSGALPDLVHRESAAAASNHVVLLSKQFQRKEQLKNEVEAGRERLLAIKKEVHALQLENSPEFRTRLKKEIKHLQAQCERLTRDVDMQSESGGGVPLGEINADFYRHIYKGQRGSLRPSRQQQSRQHVSATIHHPPGVIVADNDNEPHWQCHLCTFRNHPLMNKCEQCDMPRVLLGNTTTILKDDAEQQQLDNTNHNINQEEDVVYPARHGHATNSNPPLFSC